MTNLIICQATTTTKLISDWTFWAFVVSAIALILSQLPPIKRWFKAARIELDIYPRILINHKVGNPTLQSHISITNVGGREIKINKISFRILRNDKEIANLDCRTYNDRKSDTNRAILFTPFRIRVGEEWSNTLDFYNPFERDDDKKYRDLENKLKNDIFEKRKKLSDQNQIVDADDENVQPFKVFMSDKFIWNHGDYQIDLLISTDNTPSKIYNSYRFILFESDKDFLENYQTEYKTGAGIYYDSINQKGVNIEISEK